MAHNTGCVCPFCGCYYDHCVLMAFYDRAERGATDIDSLLEEMHAWQKRVLAEAGNAAPSRG